MESQPPFFVAEHALSMQDGEEMKTTKKDTSGIQARVLMVSASERLEQVRYSLRTRSKTLLGSKEKGDTGRALKALGRFQRDLAAELDMARKDLEKAAQLMPKKV